MDLEPIGESFNVKRLKDKLKKRYPNHNFDVPAEPDTQCKAPYLCNKSDKITYTDTEGNLYCGLRFKQSDKDDPYKWQWETCHALIRKVNISSKYEELQDDIF
jgi:hypothetical protein|tara:strand:+ start:370 stop:678 length:309 start_codon:yes stop_codon:yes gene_type:complete